jgi:CheY-like chemotaxis protein
MSGLDLLRALRSSPEGKDAVLAVHTAMGQFDLRMIEREANVQIDVFMTKPLNQQKLSKLLAELKNKRQAAPSLSDTK